LRFVAYGGILLLGSCCKEVPALVLTEQRVASRTVTLCEITEEWIRRPGISASMRSREKWSAKLALDHFGYDRTASTITPGELRAWAIEMVSVYAPESARVTIACVRNAFQAASDEGVLIRNPARDGLPRGIGSTLTEVKS
jgi:hypothetical protein